MIDLLEVKSGEIKVQVEDDNVLVCSDERKREEVDEKERSKRLRMERRMGKFIRKFALSENANVGGYRWCVRTRC